MPHSRRLPRACAVALLAALPLAALPATTAGAAAPAGPGAVAADAAERTVSGGRLDWGIKASFQSYVTGPTAQGSWTLNGGAATADQSRFRFHSASGSYAPGNGALDASFSGGVHFTGHKKSGGAHELDLTISNPTVRISGGSGTLHADIRSKSRGSGRITSRSQVPLASLGLSGVDMRGAKGPVALTQVPATLTAEGATSFAGYYTAGTPLDPVSLSVDLNAQQGKKKTPGAGEKTGGEGKGEKKGKGEGKPEDAGRIEDAAVDWGVRRTFREYVTGSLAKGKWKLTDGAQDGGALFRFGHGKGEYDAEEGTLEAEFSGAVRFTGKDLDLALSEVSVRVEDGEGTLSAAVEHEGKSAGKQPLVTFDAGGAGGAGGTEKGDRGESGDGAARKEKPALTQDGKGLVTLTEAPAKLTSEGAEAFAGMYAKGTAMDPVSLAVALDGKAELPALPDLGSGASASGEKEQKTERYGQNVNAAPASSAASPVPLIATGAGVAVLLAAGIAFAVVRKRRGGRPAD